MSIEVIIANYSDPKHQQDIPALLNQYAQDPMGSGAPLATNVLKNLTAELAKVPNAFSVLCYVNQQPAGLANCFQGFSTFKCKPLINIHDLAVLSQYRGVGISQRILHVIEQEAQLRGCCKITLEVLEGNHIAQQAYLKFGFAGYQLDVKTGKALFWEKPIS
ncbi:GNAT family N-acetyltransferase [Neptunicella sp.]|uniref:GNAT family N-acetyltransferase n=1 Tax=Neptunicella sp. TaxID=2125986 RepID=UPI003F693CCB